MSDVQLLMSRFDCEERVRDRAVARLGDREVLRCRYGGDGFSRDSEWRNPLTRHPRNHASAEGGGRYVRRDALLLGARRRQGEHEHERPMEGARAIGSPDAALGAEEFGPRAQREPADDEQVERAKVLLVTEREEPERERQRGCGEEHDR